MRLVSPFGGGDDVDVDDSNDVDDCDVVDEDDGDGDDNGDDMDDGDEDDNGDDFDYKISHSPPHNVMFWLKMSGVKFLLTTHTRPKWKPHLDIKVMTNPE